MRGVEIWKRIRKCINSNSSSDLRSKNSFLFLKYKLIFTRVVLLFPGYVEIIISFGVVSLSFTGLD